MRYLLLLSGLVGFLFVSTSTATIIHVPADYPTIQAGINASVNGDTVLVAQGTYRENIDFIGRIISLFSATGPGNTIIINDIAGIAAIRFHNGESNLSTISGFTLVGDSTSWGIECTNSSPIIYGNIIQGFQVGVKGTNSASVVRNNTIKYCDHTYSPQFGGAILFQDSHDTVIDSNTIYDNSSIIAGGMFLGQCYNVVIQRNLLYLNQGSQTSGMHFSGCSAISIFNNTIAKQSGNSGNGTIAFYMCSNMGVRNNIISNNNAWALYAFDSGEQIICDYNDFYQNNQGDFYAIIPQPNNIFGNPYYLDFDNDDFRLAEQSPCIDAGDPSSPLDPDGTRADMGALYFDQGLNRTSWYISVGGNDTTGDGSEENPFRTIQHGIDMASDGDTVLIGPGTYTGLGNRAITTNGKAILVKGAAGADSTMIDAEGDSSIFVLDDSDQPMMIQGLTLTDAINGILHASCCKDDTVSLRQVRISNCTGYGIDNGIDFLITYLIDSCQFDGNNIAVYQCGGLFKIKNSQFSNNLVGLRNCYDYTMYVDSCLFNDNIRAIDQGYFEVSYSTIRGGDYGVDFSYAYGGQVFMNSCVIESTQVAALYSRSGVYSYFSILNSQIVNNSTAAFADVMPSQWVGSLIFDNCYIAHNPNGINWGSLSMKNCIFEHSLLGISISGSFISIDIDSCIISHAYGIRISGLPGSTGDQNIRNSLFVGNPWHGLEGIDCPNLLVDKCTFENNEDAITIDQDSKFKLSNSIISHSWRYGIWATLDTLDDTIAFSDVWSNAGGNYIGLPDQTGLNGNISENPLYVDGEPYDYHLLAPSPCIDAGDPLSEPDSDATRADMGAYYYHQMQLNPFNLISPGQQGVLTNTLPSLEWSRSSHTDTNVIISYRVYWDDNGSFATPDSSGDLPDTAYAVADSLSRSISYYWKVTALGIHAFPRESDETRSFYIDGFPTPPAIIEPPNGAQANSSTYLIWLASTDPDSFDAVSYSIQVDNDSAFASPEINQSGMSSRSLLLDDAFAIMLGQLEGYGNLQADTSYFWRVRADDNYGLSSEWTDGANWFTFLPQNHAPAPPDSGFSPANGEEVISLTPVITWNDADDPDPDDNGDNLSYVIRLSEDSLFAGFVYYDTTAPGINQITPSYELDDNTHYYYQVKTLDDGGLSSDWSARQNFWTNHYNFPPEPFPLYGPESGARQVVFNTHFGWGGTVDYDPNSSFTYSFQWSADSLFASFVRTIPGLTDTVLTIPTDTLSLLGQNIFWRILAIDNDSLIQTGGIPEHFRALDILPPGDANSNGVTNGVDVTYLVNYLKGLGPAPDPLLAGDANGNCQTNGVDVSYLVNYLKGFGSAPLRPNCLPGM